MGLFSSFFEKRLTPSRPGLAALGHFGVASTSGVTVGETSALGYPAFYACVKVIAEDIAQLPLKFFQRASDGGKQERRDDPRWAMLHDEANPEMTAFDLRVMMAWQVAVWGNAYAEIEWNDAGYPVALWPLLPDPMSTELVRADDKQLYYRVRIPEESGRKVLPAWRVLHLRNLLGSSGLVGKSALRLHMESVGFGLALQEFGSTYFGNGARPGGVLEHPGKLSKEAQTRLVESFNTDHGGLSNSHRLRILEEGMKYSPITVPPEEAQFLQSRTFQLGEMARIFRLQPHMIGDLSRSTNNNIEQQSLEHVIYTLQPWLIGFEQAYRRALLLPKEKRSLSFEHAVNGLLRGDFNTRYAGYALGRQWGWLSVNDILRLENMNPVPGGDARLSPLNMVEVGQKPAEAKRGGIPRRERRADDDIAADRRRLTDAQRPLIEDAAGRVVRRETNDIRRAVQKYLVKGDDLQGFRLWLVEFYEEHRDFIGRQMGPIFDALGRLVLAAVAAELGEDGLDQHDAAMLEESQAFVDEMAFRWSLGNRNELDSLTREGETSEIADALQTRLDGWEESEAGKIGMRQAVSAVGSLSLAAYGLAGVVRIRWMISGRENCPYCASLSGKVVGIREAFVSPGDWQPEGADAPMKIRRSAFHPPVHDVCDCVIIGG